MSNPDLPPDSITTLPPEARLYAIRRRYDAMAYSGPTPADRERDTVIGHLLDLIDQRTQQITDPDFPDLVGMVGGPMIPCKVVQITATTVPTTRVEGVGELDATYEQTQRYVIRYQPKPIEVTYMAGVHDEEFEAAKQAVLETAVALYDEQRPPPGRVPAVTVGQEFTPEHRYVLRAYRKAHGQPTVGAGTPTAVEVNGAVTWWNQRQEAQRD